MALVYFQNMEEPQLCQDTQEGISRKFAKEAALRQEIARIYSLAKHFMSLAQGHDNCGRKAVGTLLPFPIPVAPSEISDLVSRAEEIGLVNRAGMELSGLDFVRGEKEYSMHDTVAAEIVMPTVMQIHREARRAMNALKNEEGYVPRRNRLYGPDIKWTPLIP
jgi:hypothetical protein